MRTAKNKIQAIPSKPARRGKALKLTKKQARNLQAAKDNPDEGGYPGLKAMFSKRGFSS